MSWTSMFKWAKYRYLYIKIFMLALIDGKLRKFVYHQITVNKDMAEQEKDGNMCQLWFKITPKSY